MEKFWQNGYNPVLREAVETQRGDINYFLPLIYAWVKNYAQQSDRMKVVELGVRGGESTVALASAVMEINEVLGKPAHLYSVDIAPMLDVCRVRIEKLGADRYWTFHEANDMEITDDVILKQYPEQSVVFIEERWIDILFLDTSHEREHTIAELEKWMPKVKKIAFFHDTCSRPEGVGQPLADYAAAHPEWEYTNIKLITGLGIMIRK